MANIKSQIKRNKQNEKRRLNNRNVRGASRTAVSQARASLDKSAPETKETVLKAISTLDKAAGKGVIHKNAAVAAGDTEAITAAVSATVSVIDKTAERGIIHKNAAARRKGRLMKKLASFVPVEATETKATKKSK